MRKFFSYSIGFLIPLCTVYLATSLVAGPDTYASYRNGQRRFTLTQAIETALRQNPDILRARQDIERTKGLVVEVRAEALPQLEAIAAFQRTDPDLGSSGFSFAEGSPGLTPTPSATITPTATPPGTGDVTGFNPGSTDNAYNLRFQVTQLIFAGGAVRGAISAAAFERDASYFGLRNAVDTVIATVRTQFYQILLNRALIGVQEESLRLLDSQLTDQQNRFEAGTVPRFNVLQAQVALSNQRPELFAARNNLRIAELQLARTLGLNFDPLRGNSPPLEAVGQLEYRPRRMPLVQAIAMATERRSFLKQQRAAILAQREQIRIALAGYLPTVRANAGYEFQSSPFSSDIDDVSDGYTIGVTGNWPLFDGFATEGRVKQARALLATAEINLADGVRQVELEVQQAYSNLEQTAELIRSQSETVAQADEALRLASARLGAGAGTQLEVLNARVEVTRAQSVRLQALFTYASAQAEFDRVTATDTVHHVTYQDPLKGRETRTEKITRKEEAKRQLREERETRTTTRRTRQTTRPRRDPGSK